MEQLIDNVREHENLYNNSLSTYRDQKLRNESWKEVANSMNKSVSECKEMWMKLRNCFLNAIRRRFAQCKKGEDGKRLSVWKYYHQMSFLLPYLDSKALQDNIEQSITTKEPIIKVDCIIDEEQINQETGGSEGEIEIPIEIPIETTVRRKRKLKTIIDDDSSIEIPQEYCKEKPNLQNWDEVDMFYLSMANCVKRLPKIDQAKIRMEICRMISEAEIIQLNYQEN